MLAVDLDTVRVFLHVLAATVWVGGQLVLAALVPVLRRAAPEAPRAAARQFNRVAWPAFGLLLVTGVWNVTDAGSDTSDDYRATLVAKLVAVLVSGGAAAAHMWATTPRDRAVWGSVTALSALAALFLGVLLGT